jgi:hypothetical protein
MYLYPYRYTTRDHVAILGTYVYYPQGYIEVWGNRSSLKERAMCSPARCASCGKTTWRGCGQHVDAVMARVAPPDRCQCEQPTHQGLFTRLFRRR